MRNGEDYEVLLAVADHGSLTAAAASLGRSLQSVSRALAALERQLNVTLFNRTTRRVYPTAACIAFIDRIRPAVREIAAARELLVDHGQQLRGAIRLAAPTWFGTQYAVPAVAEFLRMHSGVSIELVLSERHVDLAGDAIDVSLRLGTLPASDLKAKRVGTLRRVIFGAPSYLAARGYPSAPADLANHECLLRKSTENEAWLFGPEPCASVQSGCGGGARHRACAALAGTGVCRRGQYRTRLDRVRT
jgi:DNA-binding transcriptional LysR family regulator